MGVSVVTASRSIITGIAIAMGVAGCTSTPATPAGTALASPPTPAPSVTTRGSSADQGASMIQVSDKQRACLTATPGGLRGALASGWELPISGHRFWALAVAGDRVYGNGGTDDGIYVADVADRSVHRVSSESGASGVGWMAANDVALTWLTYDSPSDPTKWSLYAAEPEGGNVRKIAGSPKDQQDGQGKATQPALAGHHLAWTQSRPGTAASDLRVLDLRTGKAVTVATGDISPPVAMGATFVWPERASSQAWTFKAIDSTSLRKIALPSGLPTTGDGIGQVAGTPDKLIWGSSDFLTLNVWDKPSGRVARYETDPTSEHVFQFMKPTGSLLTWDASWPYSIMNMTTGKYYDVGKDVGLAAGDGKVAISWMSKHDKQKNGARGPARLTILNEGDVPIPSGNCTA